MVQRSHPLAGRSGADRAPLRRNRLVREKLSKMLLALPRVFRPSSDALRTRRLSTMRRWLSRHIRRRRTRKALTKRLNLQLLLHAQAMKEAFQEAEETARAEIALRIRAERQAREEAEMRLEIERVARHEAERMLQWLCGPLRRAHPEAIEEAQREMMSRIEAEQLATREVRGTVSSIR